MFTLARLDEFNNETSLAFIKLLEPEISGINYTCKPDCYGKANPVVLHGTLCHYILR
ncbi:hypothetical protein SAMN05660293_04042 [Dyadobacter psychrophilus]|uniref:Uncharacterized protein n=1 Tax=Dyadobacter psychrophilus TaxID=651661 RepID=A0A1T5GK63_9BACT|nr:hypothetical protein SAMN05660293_04042 [Dyadobacter psychrophilus]